MKKQTVVIVAVVVILLAVGAFFVAGNKKSSTAQPSQSQTAVKQENKAETLQTSLKSLLTMGKTVECTYTTTEKDVNVSGKLVAANGKLKQDFTSELPQGGSVNGHMIVDGTTAYMWTDQMKQGFKFDLASMPTPPAGANASKSAQTQGTDINKAMNLSCVPWTTANKDVFTPPADVTFQTMNIPSVPSGANPANKMMSGDKCSACDNLPAGAAQNACKAQLQCK